MPPSRAARFTSGPPPSPRTRRADDRAPDLLLERLEQAGREHEHHRPENVQRGVVVVRQPLRREDLEAVRAQTDDDQARADRPGAFGYGKLLGGARQPLYALDHEHDRLLAARVPPSGGHGVAGPQAGGGDSLAACGNRAIRTESRAPTRDESP